MKKKITPMAMQWVMFFVLWNVVDPYLDAGMALEFTKHITFTSGVFVGIFFSVMLLMLADSLNDRE